MKTFKSLTILLMLSSILLAGCNSKTKPPFYQSIDPDFWHKHRSVLNDVYQSAEKTRHLYETGKTNNLQQSFQLLDKKLSKLTVQQLEYLYINYEDPQGKITKLIHDNIVEFWKKRITLQFGTQQALPATTWLFRFRKGIRGRGLYADDTFHVRSFVTGNRLPLPETIAFRYPKAAFTECYIGTSWKTVSKCKLQLVSKSTTTLRAAVTLPKQRAGTTLFLWYKRDGDYLWKKCIWLLSRQQ